MTKNSTYKLFYDEVFIGDVLEKEANFPNIYCEIELADLKGSVPWKQKLEEYISSTQYFHEKQLAGEPQVGDEYLQKKSEFFKQFGKHLWYLVHEDGHIIKIRSILFGVDKHFRYCYYPSKISYDLRKLETRLRNRYQLLEEALEKGKGLLTQEEFAVHKLCLAQLSSELNNFSKNDVDIEKLLGHWFGSQFRLCSPIPLFSDYYEKRHLDQGCALD